ncbi:site-specific integrase [Bacteroides thetaiotaomicron]|jgi:integrase|uniref:site-specific integrase n=2 Tax=Bacteroides thetaiotaomicron TaxID=818 RepID=UPI00233EDECF|nr:site-specific integrase [Bacteroides thetaiotaomicron]MDC2248150.1 phage integrase SAM-like domain-containing protein [Bacteroides thetaiotaomicron]MDC2253264.1 phage integrase SAM-like domain-containing protein [Bacteroides thetaiotaomicron]
MVRSSFAILFFIRESRVRKDGTTSIEVVLTVNGERCSFSTGKKVKVISWDKNKQLVKGKDEEATSLNNYLKSVRAKLYEKEAELLDRGFVITAQLLYDAYFDKVACLKERSLLSVLEEHNAERKAMVGKTVAPATYWVFEYTGRLLKEFILKKYNREDLYLRELNIGFIQGFHSFLLGEKKMGQNSSTKHLKFLKKLLNLAVSNSYISNNPVNAYKIERIPVETDFLDEEELRKIINFDTPISRFEKARDFFLFGCFTGLSYIDIKTLAPEHFEKDSEGRIWIKKRRIKTGILSRIPLLPIAKLILDKYKGGNRLIPIQDPADINKYLKDIAILCNINKRITFHTSRHTFASTVTLANNISLEVVSKMMGHTNTRMTTHYAKLIDKCIGEQMDKLMDTFTGETEY